MGTSNIGDLVVEGVKIEKSPLWVTIKTTGKQSQTIGEETLRLDSVQGSESISQPFEFQLEMRANDYSAGRKKFHVDDMLGAETTITYVRPSKEKNAGEEVSARYFNGIISDFSYADPGVYQATVKPVLWKATLTNRYQLYTNKTIEDVISEVLGYHNIDFEMNVDTFAIDRQQDWLQAGETDFAFIQRLMQKAFICYYFCHTEDKHTMVITNKNYYKILKRTVGKQKQDLVLNYIEANEQAQSYEQDTSITQYQFKKSLATSGVQALAVRSEAAWESDSIAGFVPYQGEIEGKSTLPFHDYKVYQYGAGDDSEPLTDKNWQMINSAASGVSGSSTSPLLSAGHTFKTISDATFDSPEYSFDKGKVTKKTTEIRPELDNLELVVTQVQHKMSATELYSNSFQATDPSLLVTPFNIQDTQQGAVLGTVLATGGATHPKGWKYRRKTDFEVETEDARYLDNKAPEDFSERGMLIDLVTGDMAGQGPVWIKLAQHMQTVPEVGSTVIVGRSNDESEMPEVQSIVQTNGNMVIMPSGWLANTTVGSNYSTSYGDGISIRFGLNSSADLDNAISIVEGKYNTGKYRDSSYSQGGSYSYSTADQGKDGLLSTSDTYGCTESTFYGGYTTSYSEIGTSTSVSKIDTSKNTSTIGYSYNKSTIDNSDSYTTINDRSYSESTIGKSESYTTIEGENISENTVNGKTTSTSTNNADIDSTNTVNGNTTSTSTNNGNIDNTNTVTGTTTSTTTNNGDITSTNTVTGKVTSTSTNNGDMTNTNTVTGDTTSTSTNHGDVTTTNTVNGTATSTSTNNGDVKNTNTINGDQTIKQTTTGNLTSHSTTTGAHSSISTFLGAKSDINASLAATSNISTFLGARSDISTSLAAANKMDLNLGAFTNVDISAGINFAAKIDAVMTIGYENKVFDSKTKTTPLEVITEPANVKMRIGNIDVEMMTFKIFM